jgi:hypothetical protein
MLWHLISDILRVITSMFLLMTHKQKYLFFAFTRNREKQIAYNKIYLLLLKGLEVIL